jgi:16S rRNA (cytosine1402-N4)-methyltransferase
MSQGLRPIHVPVLLEEVVTLLASDGEGVLVDGTVGLGGHAEALLEADSLIHLVGIDRDAQALQFASERLARFGSRVKLVHGDYADLERHLDRIGLGTIDGMLLDLGVSSLQLDDPARGFSLREDGPLDMRMDPSIGRSAAEWLADVPRVELQETLWRYGEERYAGRIARAIVRARERGPLTTTAALVRVIHGAVPGRYFGTSIDPATRSFQAIRIAINHELDALENGLAHGFARLRSGGTFVVISFHSLEDRLVKSFARDLASDCVCPPGLPECLCDKRVEAEVLTRKPITPSEMEIQSNPRARSARLRAWRKVV